MAEIWKTNLNMFGALEQNMETTIESMGIVLNVGLDVEGIPSVWYWAPDSDHRLKTKILLLLTGQEVNEWIGGYKGTFVFDGMVMHAFEVPA